jgi:hypothetical protein
MTGKPDLQASLYERGLRDGFQGALAMLKKLMATRDDFAVPEIISAMEAAANMEAAPKDDEE